MKKPNFFIIGAPKCGTTSLAFWLSEHPQVFMTPIKEPHHFSNDFKYKEYEDNQAYQSLFEGCPDTAIAIGEASVWYLFSKVAVRNIEKEIPQSRYIVMLRNPLEMAPSLHEQIYFSGDENEGAFEKAWRLQDERKRGLNIPRLCREPDFLQYKEACMLGQQLQRLYTIVPSQRVMTILLDEIKQDPRKVWFELQHFLSVKDDGRKTFPVRNDAKTAKLQLIRKGLRAFSRLKHRLGIEMPGWGVLRSIEKWNTKKHSRQALSPELRQELSEVFRDDICLLQDLLDRDLSHWRDYAAR